MRSMTGFGCGTASDGIRSVTIEMRSVNQRYLELNIHMPHVYLAIEDAIRQNIKTSLRRGKVDVYVTVTEIQPEAPQIHVNYAMAEACKTALDSLNERLFPGTKTTMAQLLSLTKDWFSQEPPQIDKDVVWPVFRDALNAAMKGMVYMREKEGTHMLQDIQKRAETMLGFVEQIAARKDVIMELYQTRLEKRIAAVLEKTGHMPEQERLLQEVAIHADKVDFTEEVVRFRSHVVQLKEMLLSEGDIGRKLDFLIQEMNRETNTLGAKSGDMEVTAYVLQLKNEIEKIREQVQNIE